jgi:hypothetical protein
MEGKIRCSINGFYGQSETPSYSGKLGKTIVSQLWIRRSVVRVHPAVPAQNQAFSAKIAFAEFGGQVRHRCERKSARSLVYPDPSRQGHLARRR